ncbi:cobalamin synthesis protein P47K [Nostoc sp. NIES-4103]|nr:cobalamin synthesis protein P47K [Nostoc sp. NIES-4103]
MLEPVSTITLAVFTSWLAKGFAEGIGKKLGETGTEFALSFLAGQKEDKSSANLANMSFIEQGRLIQEAIQHVQETLIRENEKKIQADWEKESWMSEKLNKQETIQIFQNIQQKHSLLILTSQPEISESCSEDIRNNLKLELPNKLREFLREHYPPFGMCPVEYYGDYFKKAIGDIDIHKLCQVLNAIPTVVVYTTITEREVFFKVGFWGISSQQPTLLYKNYHWEEEFKKLKQQGVGDKEAFRKIRDLIIAVHKLLTAFFTDLYYVSIDPSCQPQLFKPELEQEFASKEYSLLLKELAEFQQQQKDKLNQLITKQEIYNILTSISTISLSVTIVTGSSKSGKTTLINRILKSLHQDVKVAILVPNIRNTGIDITSDLLYEYEDITDDCDGCEIHRHNKSLFNTVYKVIETVENIDYLIVETTSSSDPLPIASTFIYSELRDLTHLDAIITVVDARNFSLDLFNSQADYCQIAYGDIILINKIDLVSEAGLQEWERKISECQKGARIIRTKLCQAPLPFIVSANLFEFNKYFHGHYDSDYLENNPITSVFFQSDKPFIVKKFEYFLDNQLPNDVFQIKGILWFQESPKRHIFQIWGRRFSFDDDEWKGDKKNQLMLIGKNLNRETLVEQLENCL